MTFGFFRSLVVVLAFFLCGLAMDGPARSQEDEEEADKPSDEEVLGAQRIIMAPMNISLFESNRLTARVNIELILEVQDLADVEDIRDRVPQLRSDFLTALNLLARERFSIDRPIDPELIKLYVLAYADRRLGKGKIDVFVQEAYIQPL